MKPVPMLILLNQTRNARDYGTCYRTLHPAEPERGVLTNKSCEEDTLGFRALLKLRQRYT